MMPYKQEFNSLAANDLLCSSGNATALLLLLVVTTLLYHP
jgi:hypothetical protein